ncbi:MAG: T9SS type A sorting domain-containing protein [Bacteroidetes bacterium]|nr:T9SS type A sorting domain-containing protein [Bacteroidota bacterium]
MYYIFTAGPENYVTGFQYNIVDMSSNGGLGSVILKNQILYTPTTERINAITHGNGTDIWILSHASIGNEFVAYLLTAAGLNPVPVISNVGPVFNTANLNSLGYLKFSPQGNRVAMAVYEPDFFYVFDFDSLTGILTNPITLNSTGSNEGAYGVEFSPNGHVLYGSSSNFVKLFQWDLSSGNSVTINASRIDIPATTMGGFSLGGIQLAPNGKIYIAHNTSDWLSVVNNPNIVGFGCNYVDSGIYLLGKLCQYGLPNLNQSAYRSIGIEKFCFGDATNFSANDSINYVSFEWNFDDPASGPLNVSYSATTSHVYTSTGNYTAQLIRTNLVPPFSDTTFYNLTINALPVVNLGNDTIACASLVLDGGAGFTNYLWNNGTSTQTMFTNSSATYTVTVTDANGCMGSDVILAIVNPNPQIIFNAFAMDTLCKNAGLQTINPPNPLGGTLTGNGLTGLTFDPSAVATGWNYFYYVYLDSNSCSNAATDSVWVDNCLGVNLLEGNIYFMVAPNPTNDFITITTNLASSNCIIALHDMLGKELLTQKLNATNTQINLQGLSAGNYLLKLFDENNLLGVKRAVKMK